MPPPGCMSAVSEIRDLAYGRFESLHPVGFLPGNAQILTAHVPVGGEPAVNGFAQIQVADNGGGAKVEHLPHGLADNLVVHSTGA